MENNRDDLVVILAGYADKMDKFFQSNPGFRSRVAHHIDFPDYRDEELLSIAEGRLAKLNYKLSPVGAPGAVRIYPPMRRVQPDFRDNALLDPQRHRTGARLRQANRCFASGEEVDLEQLVTRDRRGISGRAGYLLGRGEDARRPAPR